jgi:hypothetical protein
VFMPQLRMIKRLSTARVWKARGTHKQLSLGGRTLIIRQGQTAYCLQLQRAEFCGETPVIG